MKKIIPTLLFLLILLPLSGCSVPDSLQLDLSQGYGSQLKLLHLNASTSQRRQRIEGFEQLWQDAQPLEKGISLFAYYPDYQLTVTRDGQKTTVIVDVNGQFVDFHYPDDPVVYRSSLSAQDLRKLVHQYA